MLPDRWIPRWDLSLPAFAFGSGLLLAFALIEPRIGIRAETEPDSSTAPVMPYTPYVPPEPLPETPVTAVQPAVAAEPDTTETVVTNEPLAVDERPTRLLPQGSSNAPENPVQVVQPTRPDDPDV